MRRCCCNKSCPPYADFPPIYCNDPSPLGNTFITLTPVGGGGVSRNIFCGGKSASISGSIMTSVNHGLAEGDVITLLSARPEDYQNSIYYDHTLRIPYGSSGGSPIIDADHVDLGVSTFNDPSPSTYYYSWTKAVFSPKKIIVCDYSGTSGGYHNFTRSFGPSGGFAPVQCAEKWWDTENGGAPNGPFSSRRYISATVQVSVSTSLISESLGSPGVIPVHNEYIVLVHDGTYAIKRRWTLSGRAWTKETDHGFIDCGCSGFFKLNQLQSTRRWENSGPGFSFPHFDLTVSSLAAPYNSYNGTFSPCTYADESHWIDGFQYGGRFRKVVGASERTVRLLARSNLPSFNTFTENLLIRKDHDASLILAASGVGAYANAYDAINYDASIGITIDHSTYTLDSDGSGTPVRGLSVTPGSFQITEI